MKKTTSTLFVLLATIIYSICTNAHNIRQITSRDGLSNSAVICLFQDSERYLWAGTYDGLNKYNGVEIKTYKPNIKNSYGLTGNVIRKIVESKNDYLWIMTKGGLNKYSKKHDMVEACFNTFQEDCSIACDSHGNIFILSRTGLLHFYDFEEQVFKEMKIPNFKPQKNWVSLLIDGNNQMWLTNEGTSQLYTIDYSEPHQLKAIPIGSFDSYVNYIYCDNGKIIVIDEKYNLAKIENNEKVFIKNLQATIQKYGTDISSILYDNDDLIIGFRTSGVVRLNHKKGYAVEKIPINCGVFSLLKDDAQDILWIGTDGQGIYACVQDGYVFKGINLKELPIKAQRPVRAIYNDHQNNLWLGTKGNGIIRIKDFENATEYDQQNVTLLSEKDGLSNNAVFSFEMSPKHNVLWIGSSGPKLNYYSFQDKKIHALECNPDIPFVEVHSILETNDTTLWVSSLFSLLKINLHKEGNAIRAKHVHRYEFDIKNKQTFNKIYSICMENDSIMWLAMRGNGAIRFNTDNGNYRLFNFEDHGIVPMNDILSIFINKENIWLGSSYGITAITSKEGGFNYHNYNENDGLQNNTIHGILEDEDQKLWLSSNAGIILFDPNKDAFRKFDQKSGLKVTEFSDNAYYKDSNTSLCFFGGIDGVIWIKHDEKKTNDFVPPIYFTKLRILNKEVDKDDFLSNKRGKDYLRFRHNQNFFTISFSTNDFINGSNLHFSYKLEKFNEVWMNANTQEAQFTNIPPGDYVLKVKYYNEFEDNSQQASINITILPPWYFSLYAKLFYFLATAGLLFILYIYIKRKYEKKKEHISRQLKQKYKEEMYENKLRFFTNITHEFCTPLTLIYTPCERLLSYEGSDSLVKKYAQIIKSNTERLNSLIQEIIDFRRMETGHKSYKIEPCNMNELCEALKKSFSNLIEENHIDFCIDIRQTIIWNSDRSCMATILNNLVSNAFKYTPENGSIKISLNVENEELTLKVYNSGKGIRKEDMPFIFNRYSVLDNVKQNSIKGLSSRNGLGLAICKSIVDALDGKIDIESQPGKYAEFIIRLPNKTIQEPADKPFSASENLIKNDLAAFQGNYHTAAIIDKKELDNNSTQTDPDKKPAILIIDDNEEVLWILKDILSEEYNVFTAKDGREGFKQITNNMPDLIITDIMMPNQDGISLTKQIKTNPYTTHIPIVIISAKSTIDDKIEGIESGADSYITKPFEVQYVKTLVRQQLEKHQKLREYYNSSASSYDYVDGQLLSNADRDFIQSAILVINQNIDNIDFNPEDLADQLHTSLRSMYRKFKEIGLPSPKDFIKKQRVEYSAKLLVSTKLSIQEIMYNAGFTTRSHFYKEFAKHYNMSPKEYRKQSDINVEDANDPNEEE